MQAVDTRRRGWRPAHPFSVFVRKTAENRGLGAHAVERIAGIAESSIGQWTNYGVRPRIDSIEAALNVLGFKLQIVPLDAPASDLADDGAPD